MGSDVRPDSNHNNVDKNDSHADSQQTDFLRQTILDTKIEARDRARHVHADERQIIPGSISGNTGQNKNSITNPTSDAILIHQDRHKEGSPINCSWTDWNPHPFRSKTPFVLWIRSNSDIRCPRLQVTIGDPISHVLGVGVLALEDVIAKTHRAADFVPLAFNFLSWFRHLQRRSLGDNISLLDPWLYLDLNRPGIESFHRKVWALFSMIGFAIVLPNFSIDSVRLQGVRLNYQLLEIDLQFRQGPKTHFAPLPSHLQADKAFEIWLGNMDVLSSQIYSFGIRHANIHSSITTQNISQTFAQLVISVIYIQAFSRTLPFVSSTPTMTSTMHKFIRYYYTATGTDSLSHSSISRKCIISC